jgi:hypothetical protein
MKRLPIVSDTLTVAGKTFVFNRRLRTKKAMLEILKAWAKSIGFNVVRRKHTLVIRV